MQSWGLAVTNPYYAITDEFGNFSLSDVPKGIYTLIAWHPGMAGNFGNGNRCPRE